MISKGHSLLIDEALRLFLIKYPREFSKLDVEQIKKGIIDPDYMEKPLGSHYAILENGEFYNRIKKNPINAYTMLVSNYERALKEKSMYRLGFALHFVEDMLTVPHATGVTDATLWHFLTKPHRKYERYTAINMNKYFKDVNIDESFFMGDIKEIMMKYQKQIQHYNIKDYELINKEMIPIILEYTIGFLYRYLKESGEVNE